MWRYAQWRPSPHITTRLRDNQVFYTSAYGPRSSRMPRRRKVRAGDLLHPRMENTTARSTVTGYLYVQHSSSRVSSCHGKRVWRDRSVVGRGDVRRRLPVYPHEKCRGCRASLPLPEKGRFEIRDQRWPVGHPVVTAPLVYSHQIAGQLSVLHAEML